VTTNSRRQIQGKTREGSKREETRTGEERGTAVSSGEGGRHRNSTQILCEKMKSRLHRVVGDKIRKRESRLSPVSRLDSG